MSRSARRLVWLLPAVVGLAACGGSTRAPLAIPPEEVYARQCASCHGTDRQGAGELPALDGARMNELGAAELRRIVLEGPGAMPGFEGRLTDDQLDVLVAQLLAA